MYVYMCVYIYSVYMCVYIYEECLMMLSVSRNLEVIEFFCLNIFSAPEDAICVRSESLGIIPCCSIDIL